MARLPQPEAVRAAHATLLQALRDGASSVLQEVWIRALGLAQGVPRKLSEKFFYWTPKKFIWKIFREKMRPISIKNNLDFQVAEIKKKLDLPNYKSGFSKILLQGMKKIWYGSYKKFFFRKTKSISLTCWLATIWTIWKRKRSAWMWTRRRQLIFRFSEKIFLFEKPKNFS